MAPVNKTKGKKTMKQITVVFEVSKGASPERGFYVRTMLSHNLCSALKQGAKQLSRNSISVHDVPCVYVGPDIRKIRKIR